MRILRIATLVALALAVLPRHARADDNDWVEGRGEAPIDNDDTETAHQRAIRAAQRDAVERKLGTFIVADSQSKDFQLVKDQVLSTAQGYVTDMQMLEDKPSHDTWVTRIKCHVAEAKVDNAAKASHIALTAMKYPRMALLIAEQHVGQAAPATWWGPQGGGSQPGQVMTVDQRLAENTLIGEWKPLGFTFVDTDALAGKLRAANVVSTNPSGNEVRQITNLLDTDVVVFGSAVAVRQGNVGEMFGDKSGESKMLSCKSTISVRILNSDNGEILATSEASAVAGGLTDLVCEQNATKLAAKQLSYDMHVKLVQAWNQQIMGASRVRLQVKNVDFMGLKELKNALNTNYKIVQSVSQKSFANGQADLDLKVEGGDAEGLAEDISTKGLGKLKVKVVGVTANTISLDAGGK